MSQLKDHKGLTIVDAVRQRVEAHPERTAFTFRDAGSVERAACVMSYAELWEKASAISDELGSLKRGDLALLVMPLGPQLLVHHLAVMMAGAAASIYAHPSPKIAPEVYARNLLHAVGQIRPAQVILPAQGLSAAAEILRAAGVEPMAALALDKLDSAGKSPKPPSGLSPSSPAVTQHSSGSTGLAKGIALSHEKVIQHCLAYGRFFDFSADRDSVCGWLPLYHDMGLFTSWLLPLIHGAAAHFIDPFGWVGRPLSILRLASIEKGTLIWQPNFAFALLASRAADHEVETLDLSLMRGFINCSEPVNPAHTRAFLRRFSSCGVSAEKLWNCYGMAENGFAVTQTAADEGMEAVMEADAGIFSAGKAVPAQDGPSKSVASCGKPIEDCLVKIVDEGGAPLEDGIVGQIAIKSPYLFGEYINNPQATQAAFDAQGWYLTGDLGFTLKGGLYVTGRKKDLLIAGGRNFYPHDIEEICHRVPGVIPGRAAALGVEDEALGTQRVVAIVESEAGDKSARDKISETVRRMTLEELDCPVSEVMVVPRMWLLKTSSGKIARRPNLEKYLEQRSKAAPARRAPAAEQPEAAPLPSLLLAAGWAFCFALVFYLFLLLVVFSANKSWIIYMEF